MLYANHYHNDGYLVTYFKLFINLMDVDENDGPLHIVYKNKQKNFSNMQIIEIKEIIMILKITI